MTNAAIYTRISEDDGSALGVARQQHDCEIEASRRGWTVVGVYTDNDVSATRSRTRPEYQRMLADVRSGHVQAVVVWDVDRLTRTPRELEDIIDMADRHSLALASVGGEIDLGTPQGRLTARIKGTVARHETEQMSRRIRRQSDERASTGRPHGRSGYGFRRVDGRDVVETEQAVIVQECTRRILAGESLRRIVSELNARGQATPTARGDWTTATLRQLLMRPSLAGLRQHRGVIVGRTNGDAIITEDQHARIIALLSDPARRTSPGTGRAPKYLLSGLAVCGLCGGRMRRLVGWTPPAGSKSKATAPAYACGECHRVRRKQDGVDAYVSEVVVARLERPDAAALFTQGDPASAKTARDAIAAIDARLANAADAYAAGELELAQLTRITQASRTDKAKHETVLSAAMPAAIPANAVGPKARETWASLDIDGQRAILDALMTVTVLPGGVGRQGFDPSLIRIDWKSGTGNSQP